VQLKFLDCVTFETSEDSTAQFTLTAVSVVSSRPKLSSFIFLLLSTSRSMATWSKEFLLEFIGLFRAEECLWKVKSKDYYNKSKKNASYRTLSEKYKKLNLMLHETVIKYQKFVQSVENVT
jgi:hypothetical protein